MQAITRHEDAMPSNPAGRLADAFANARGPLLFGIRLWVSVCLAMYVAFWLQLDNPYWAGASAAVVCQPQLGASLRKGWFRMIGTTIGVVVIVVLTACFPQDRIAYFTLLALWGGVCTFIATVLRNFASYAASLAGYTAAIVGADSLGATGGPGPDVFLLAIYRGSEICIGIACAGIVLAGTDLGGARKRLAASLANLAADIAGGFTRMLAAAEVHDTQAERRELLRRVIELDPMIDQALGESSHLRYRSNMLRAAVHGLLASLMGWRNVAVHLTRSRGASWANAESILSSIPPALRPAWEHGSREPWINDPSALRAACEASERSLLTRAVDTPSDRLLCDETATVLNGMACVLDELELLGGGVGRMPPGYQAVAPRAADWLPAAVNGARAFVTIGAVELLWVATAWPNGAAAIVFVTIVLLLMSPRGDLAFLGAVAFALTATVGVVASAIVEFAVLPGVETFPAFCAVIGLYLIPIGFAAARTRTPALTAVFGGLAVAFIRLLAPTNPMTYDTGQFYNTALAIFIACGIGAFAFRLLPPLSSALRARRLLVFTLRDLRRMAINPSRQSDWERRMYDRIVAMPDGAEPVQHARLLAALSVGGDINELRQLASRLGVVAELNGALAPLAKANSTVVISRLRQLDRTLESDSLIDPKPDDALRMRGRIATISELLAAHGSYFDAETPA
jgi:uncharacterized membrane protein YccC